MSLEPGSILNNRYRIEGRLGKGGMGAVFLAYDQTLDIKVALKENLNQGPESERQFRREAKLLASLRHPNLPRVTDHFILEDRQYLVMDFIEGEDLHLHAHHSSPTADEVVSWGNSACNALTFLHTRVPPVIHRDIKPANLKLPPDGNVVLVDFGIAKVFDQSATTTGARGLTPGFSPPEQYGGQRTDARSDQYALAATLYSLLSGQQPADSVQRMLKKERLIPIRELKPEVPEHLEAALERGMALDQENRFPDIESFRSGINGLLQLETIRAPIQGDVPAKKRNTGVWIGIAVLASILIVGGMIAGLGILLPGLISDPESSPTSDIPIVIPLEETDTPTPSPESVDPTTPPLPPATATLEPTATPPAVIVGGSDRIAFISDREDGRTLQIWTMNGDGSDAAQLTFGPGDKLQPRWSPDGKRLLYVSAGGTDDFGNDLGLDIFVYNADRSGDPVNITNNIGDDTDPTWSPQGNRVAFTSTRVNEVEQVFLMDVQCLEPPDGCSVIDEPWNLTLGYAIEYSPAWSPAGDALVVVGSIRGAGGRLFLRSLLGGDPTWYDKQDRIIGADHPTWSSDNQLLAFDWTVHRGKQEIYVSLTENPALDPTSLTNSLGNKEPVFSPDGQLIAFTSTRDQNPEIYVMTNNGSGQRNLTNNPGRDLQPDWRIAVQP